MAKVKRAKVKKMKVRKSRVKKAVPEKVKMKKMPAKDLKKYKILLLAERERISGDLSHIAENTLKKSARDASGDLSGYSYHMADVASDDYERDFSLGRATDEQNILYAIDEAIKRMEDGTYGSCLECGKPISKKRLNAVPHTEVCITCQRNKDVG